MRHHAHVPLLGTERGPARGHIRRHRGDPAFYFKARRPPLLKDFFDPRIRKALPVPKLSRLIEVTFDVRDCEVVD